MPLLYLKDLLVPNRTGLRRWWGHKVHRGRWDPKALRAQRDLEVQLVRLALLDLTVRLVRRVLRVHPAAREWME